MEESKLGMKHQSLLVPLLKSIHIPLSEYCFANLYFFRETHCYKVVDVDNDYYLSGITYDKKRYLMPLKDLKENPDYKKSLIELGEAGGFDLIFPIPETWLSEFEGLNLKTDYLEQDSDYIYRSEKMQTYGGRKLHKKRNLLKQFKEHNTAETRPLDASNIHEPLELLDMWQASSSQEMGDSDYYQCRDALIHRENFNLQGAVFYADGTAVGFMIGEAVSPSVFTIHFAKGNVSAKGIYQYMFNQFSLDFCRDYEYINLEQDLGIEGLRKTKRSYVPDHMAHKYRIHLK